MCVKMVEQDVMTPLTTFVRQVQTCMPIYVDDNSDIFIIAKPSNFVCKHHHILYISVS